jgi:hypothetical protein
MHTFLTRLTLAVSLAAALTSAGAPTARAAEATTRHPLGFSFRHPDDWQVQSARGLMRLVPPDEATSAEGPLELYFLQVARHLPDLTRAEDSRVATALDEQWGGDFPFLKRTGEPETLATGLGPGATLTWEGAPESGGTVRARAFTAVSGEFLVQLLAVGLKEHVDAREETLRAVFTSFAAAEAQHDPAVAGFWRFEKTSSLVSGDFTAATLERVELQLEADGTGFIIQTSRVVGDPGDTGEQPTSTRCEWFAGGGILCLVAEDGSFAALEYDLQAGTDGRSLTVQSAGAQPRTYVEVR